MNCDRLPINCIQVGAVTGGLDVLLYLLTSWTKLNNFYCQFFHKEKIVKKLKD